MKRHTVAVLLLIVLGALTPVVHAVLPLPIINRATVDYSSNTLPITGTNFGASPCLSGCSLQNSCESAFAVKLGRPGMPPSVRK